MSANKREDFLISDEEHKKVSTKDLRGSLSAVLNSVSIGHERVVITSHGSPRAAVIPFSDLVEYEKYLKEKQGKP
jgi:prevent-host-death family protein